jgi:hypothetical protein
VELSDDDQQAWSDVSASDEGRLWEAAAADGLGS